MKEPRVQRSLKRLVKAVGLLAGLLLMLLAALLGRLAMGPLSAGPFVPWLSGWANAALPGLEIAVENASLAWHPHLGQAEIRLYGVGLRTPDGSRLEMTRLELLCEALPLLFGELRPRSLRLEEAEAELDWNAAELKGAFELPTNKPDTEEAIPNAAFSPALPEPVMSLLRRLTPPESEKVESSLSVDRLEQVSIGFRQIRLRELGSGTAWRLPGARLRLARASNSWQLDGTASLLNSADSGGAVGKLSLDAEWHGTSESGGRISLVVRDFEPPRLAAGLPQLARLSGLKIPSRLVFEAGIGSTGHLDSATARILADGGTITWPGFYSEPRSFAGLRVNLRYEPDARRLEIGELRVKFAQATLRVAGDAIFTAGASRPRLRLHGGWDSLSTSALTHYWPRNMAASGRAWIAENIPEGNVREAELHLDLAPQDWGLSPLPASAFHLDFRFTDLKAHVLRPTPPLTGAGGTARLTADHLTMHLDSGMFDDLPVSGSTVALRELDNPDLPMGDVRLIMTGTLPAVLRLINHEPMGYVSAFGMSPDDVAGRVDLEAGLRFPLLNDLPLEEVDIDIDAAITGFAIPNLLGEEGFSEGRLTLSVDNDSLLATGHGRLVGVPLDLTWREAFASPAGTPSSHYDVEALLTKADLAKLAIDPGPYFDGRMATEMTLLGNGPNLLRGSFSGNLIAGEMRLPMLGWKKPIGKAASLIFETDFTAGDVLPIDNVIFESGADRFDGSVRVDRQTGNLRRADIERLIFGRTALAGQIEQTPDGGLVIDIAGPALDLSRFLEQMEFPDSASEDATPAPPLEIRIATERVYGVDDVESRNVNLSLARNGGYWKRISARAGLGGDRELTFDLGASRTEGLRALSLHIGDTGKVLKGLGLLQMMDRGVLDLSGHIEGFGEDAQVEGRMRLADFRLVQTPALTQGLESEDESRLNDFIGQDGLEFDEFVLPFTVGGGIIDLDDGRANGPDIGLTLEGQLDQSFERININGIIVPAYQLNSLLGKIPIIGELFTGGSGGGLFALSYRVEGAFEDPQVTIDPLTAIMPGILRKPFEGGKGTIEPPSLDPPESENGDKKEPG